MIVLWLDFLIRTRRSYQISTINLRKSLLAPSAETISADLSGWWGVNLRTGVFAAIPERAPV
jgi:hypothetical protein